MNYFRRADMRWAERYAKNWSWNMFHHGLAKYGELYTFLVDDLDYVVWIKSDMGYLYWAMLPFGEEGFAEGCHSDENSPFQSGKFSGTVNDSLNSMVVAIRNAYQEIAERSGFGAFALNVDKVKWFKEAAQSVFTRFEEEWFEEEEVPYDN